MLLVTWMPRMLQLAKFHQTVVSAPCPYTPLLADVKKRKSKEQGYQTDFVLTENNYYNLCNYNKMLG